jgi:hypothetical protein
MNKQLYSYCLQGDVNKAYEYLLETEPNQSIEKLRKKYYNRFFADSPILRYKSKDLWIRSVLKAYYEYFIVSLTMKKNKDEAEMDLTRKLIDILPGQSGTNDLDVLESMLKEEFQARGYYFLGGVTAPFRGPYIWRQEEKVEFDVSLPFGQQTVTVYFMTDFILQSWLHFATFGGMATGGWATTDALYCVKDSYAKVMNKPRFLVSYLKHEAQHFKDYIDFPDIDSNDLEYRAKLIELIYQPKNVSLMHSFILHADHNKENPHPYACYLIVSHLSKMVFSTDFENDADQWTKIGSAKISTSALQLFETHTQSLTGKQVIC